MTDIICHTPLAQRNRSCQFVAKYELCDENHSNITVACGVHLRKRLNSYDNPELVHIHSISNNQFIYYPNPLSNQWRSVAIEEVEETINLDDNDNDNDETRKKIDLPLLIKVNNLHESVLRYITSYEHIHLCEQFIKYDEINDDSRPILSYYQRLFPKARDARDARDATYQTTNISDTCVDHNQCCVCMESFEKDSQILTLYSCGHSFHYSCIMNWYTPSVYNGMGKCPECREWIECEVHDEINTNIKIFDTPDEEKDLEYILHMSSRD